MTDPADEVPALVLPAPAKLNLFLHITGRRPDGYHDIQTIFQLLDWGDEIGLSLRDDGRIERIGGMPEVAPDDDLAIRAARLLQSETGVVQGADITVNKRVPAGAGLGGGSSDAATVLLGLNHLWRAGLSLPELAALGLRLGADVPVFVHGRSAFAEGVGERLQPLALPDACFVLIWPGVPVSTRDAFQAPELTRNTPALTICDLPGSATRNDLEPIAVRQQPAIAQVLSWLRQFGDARMSGSGSTVFTAVASEQQAQTIAAQCPWPSWPVRGVNRSPVHRALGLDAE
jgi:4-diphosphocytidyl-2-C-methyl-D-erythritol kinase